MIQRIQSLFLLAAALMGILLLFIPSFTIIFNNLRIPLVLEPIRAAGLNSTAGHTAAVFINFAGLVIALGTVFLYQRRELQIKLCYLLALVWVVLGGMIALCPFVNANGAAFELNMNAFVFSFVGLAIVAALMAARFIKKDIDLLKSADRIR